MFIKDSHLPMLFSSCGLPRLARLRGVETAIDVLSLL